MRPTKILRAWPPIPWEKVPSNHHWPTSELSGNQLLQCSAALLLEIVHPWHPKNSWHEKDSCSCLSKKSSCLMTGLRTYICHSPMQMINLSSQDAGNTHVSCWVIWYQLVHRIVHCIFDPKQCVCVCVGFVLNCLPPNTVSIHIWGRNCCTSSNQLHSLI